MTIKPDRRDERVSFSVWLGTGLVAGLVILGVLLALLFGGTVRPLLGAAGGAGHAIVSRTT